MVHGYNTFNYTYSKFSFKKKKAVATEANPQQYTHTHRHTFSSASFKFTQEFQGAEVNSSHFTLTLIWQKKLLCLHVRVGGESFKKKRCQQNVKMAHK